MSVIAWPSIANKDYRHSLSVVRNDMEYMLRLVEKRPALKADMLTMLSTLTTRVTALP